MGGLSRSLDEDLELELVQLYNVISSPCSRHSRSLQPAESSKRSRGDKIRTQNVASTQKKDLAFAIMVHTLLSYFISLEDFFAAHFGGARGRAFAIEQAKSSIIIMAKCVSAHGVAGMVWPATARHCSARDVHDEFQAN